MTPELQNHIIKYLGRLDEYCDNCGDILNHIKEPLQYFPFAEIIEVKFESGDLYPALCYYCEKDLKKPFLWIGDLPGYIANRNGNVWSTRTKKYLKPSIHYIKGKPDLYVRFKKKRVCFHTHKIIILKYKFDTKSAVTDVIRHEDDEPLNNHDWNLSYGTSKENAADRERNKRRKLKIKKELEEVKNEPKI